MHKALMTRQKKKHFFLVLRRSKILSLWLLYGFNIRTVKPHSITCNHIFHESHQLLLGDHRSKSWHNFFLRSDAFLNLSIKLCGINQWYSNLFCNFLDSQSTISMDVLHMGNQRLARMLYAIRWSSLILKHRIVCMSSQWQHTQSSNQFNSKNLKGVPLENHCHESYGHCKEIINYIKKKKTLFPFFQWINWKWCFYSSHVCCILIYTLQWPVQ